MRQAIGDFLLRRLQEAGIKHIFGVPGDYSLGLMQQIEGRGEPGWIGNCNELNAKNFPSDMELPSDISYLEIEVRESPLKLEMIPSDQESLKACTEMILKRLKAANSPAFLLDMDAIRFGVSGADHRTRRTISNAGRDAELCQRSCP
jgi:TPP-dependent 2-oxoacid decarboxylase